MMTTSFDDRDGMIWYDGEMVPWRDAKLHVLSHALHYASSVFEGERVYSGQIFESRAHTERLHKSARLMDFEIPYSVDEIETAKQAVMTRVGFARRLHSPGGLARQRDDGRLGPRQRHPFGHRRLGLAVLFRRRGQDEGD